MSDQRPAFSRRAKHRSAVVLLDGDKVCLIERNREGRIYYLFPGGGVEPGESHEQAAIREAKEELGLDVQLGQLLADITFKRARQTFYLARAVGGEFGTGAGEEMDKPATSAWGSYTPVWLPLQAAAERDARPTQLVRALLAGAHLRGGVMELSKF